MSERGDSSAIFDKSTEPPILAKFDPKLPSGLHTDASRLNGIGYILMQKHENETWKFVQCGSRYLSETESRYMQ